MNFNFLTKYGKNNLIMAGALLVLAVVFIVVSVERYRHGMVLNPPGNASSTAQGQPPSQQQIDTGLSLAPGSSAPAVGHNPAAALYPGCKLSLTFAITSGDLNTAGQMHYSLISENLGSVTCHSASISVYYANNETYSSSNPGATSAGYYWRIGDLGPGAQSTITLVANRTAPLAPGDATNEACLSADNGSDACSNSSAGITPPAIGGAPQTSAPATASSFIPSAGQEFGVWVWTTPDQMSSQEMHNVVNSAAANHFNIIYLTIDSYLPIAAQSDGPAKVSALANFNQSVTNFLALASQKNIAVDAEAGARDWGQPGNTTDAGRIMAFVAQYNQSHPIKFRGVQYDVEPYLLPQYETNKSSVLTNYVNLIGALVPQAKADNLPLGIVVPHFYDANEQWTPEITADGVTDYTYRHLLRLLGQLPSGNGRIIVMAYRNFLNGNDGAIHLSEDEIKEATGAGVKIIVAQETGPVTPSYVTFSGLSKSALYGQLDSIRNTFLSDKSFAGVAVDYLDPFLALPKG